MIRLSIKIFDPYWHTVYTIPQNNFLEKGRHGLYHEITEATGLIKESYGCYAWGADNLIYYCGSFSKNYKRQDFKSNFHGRVHSYLQSHKLRENGRKNTNLMVFENINTTLHTLNINLYILKFDYLEISDDIVSYSQYCENAELVRAVEQLLICSYKRDGQCMWNRG